jgi:hypothetical protein
MGIEYRFIRFTNGTELREFESGFYAFIDKDGRATRGLRAILRDTFDALVAEVGEEQE